MTYHGSITSHKLRQLLLWGGYFGDLLIVSKIPGETKKIPGTWVIFTYIPLTLNRKTIGVLEFFVLCYTHTNDGSSSHSVYQKLTILDHAYISKAWLTKDSHAILSGALFGQIRMNKHTGKNLEKKINVKPKRAWYSGTICVDSHKTDVPPGTLFV